MKSSTKRCGLYRQNMLHCIRLGLLAVMGLLFLYCGVLPLSAAPQRQSIQQVHITDVRDGSFVVSWTTDEASDGRVEWGTTTALGQTATDPVGATTTHYVVVAGLNPSTTYYFQVRSGSTVDNNGGAFYSVSTGPTLGIPVPGRLLWGYVYAPDGTTVVANAIVYLQLQDTDGTGSLGDSQWVSARTDASGVWYYPSLGNVRTATANAFYTVNDGVDNLHLMVQGGSRGSIEADELVPAAYPAQYDLRLNEPTAVTLERFEVRVDAGAVIVEWETATELDNLGFNLYRSEMAGGPYVKLNSVLVPAQNPGQVWGAMYTWLDEAVPVNTTLYYQLEDVDIHGEKTLHGPVSMIVREGPAAQTLGAFAAKQDITTMIGLLAVAVASLIGPRRLLHHDHPRGACREGRQ